jgi:hypothetical protein
MSTLPYQIYARLDELAHILEKVLAAAQLGVIAR